MTIINGQNAWPPPSTYHLNGSRMHLAGDVGPARNMTPTDNSSILMPEALDLEEDSRRAHFADLYRRSEARIACLFNDDGTYNADGIESLKRPPILLSHPPPPTTDHAPIQEPPRKKAKRIIDENDYGDDDDENDDENTQDSRTSQLKARNANAAAAKSLLSPSKSGSSPVHSVPSPGHKADKARREDGSSQSQSKLVENARKELEEARTAIEEAARHSFHTIFYTLENDRMAMLEQQQLEESEKQLQAEMDKTNSHHVQQGPGSNQGSLSSANLGASSLTLKHLIARIDMKRDKVKASDAELRSLMNEVRKNRSKWANEDNVGQEELYEALDKVLSELKAHTEYSTPFLNRVNKRDAPDYYAVIKQPMDLGTMTKKLKGLQYKSKAEFVTDLNLIWDNCLKYNAQMQSPLRRMANGMRKEAEKLIPLIPEIVVRPRAEVEAEERRKQNGGDDDGGDDSDDEPIMSSRGRTAGNKGAKSRKAPADQTEGTPSMDQKPLLQLNGLTKPHRDGSEVDGSNGLGTPVGGSNTPSGANGHSGASNGDALDVDGHSLNDMTLNQALGDAAEQVYEDEEYKIWKQVTKKDRALIAKERYQLFSGNKLNPDEPALLRCKSGMRRFLKARRKADALGVFGSAQAESDVDSVKEAAKPAETLAEGMEEEVNRQVPDYYEPLIAIPEIPPKLQWEEDGEGQVINHHEEFLQTVPKGHFTSPASHLATRFEANLRQIQETRKVCAKIGVVKQMQIQTQLYTNQFPKYNPEPFLEHDIEAHYISGDGPVIAPGTCRAALQRSVAKIFYHVGYEELQPSALETMTDFASDYLQKIARTFQVYAEADKMVAVGSQAERGAHFQPRFTTEEVILHMLGENGHDVESLESYARDDLERFGTKLGAIHNSMKAHLADLLRPALNDAGPDGAGAFNEGSEQFVSGDFAEELGEDFFGFKSLGLDRELGLEMLSVPLHLLQSRVRNQYQMQNQAGSGVETENLIEPLPPSEPVTTENIQDQISLVKNFFLAKLHANGDQPLVEDEDLPVKQRRPRPRLGATGKIVSPQKRPPKEQIAAAKKRKKLEMQAQAEQNGKNAGYKQSADKNVTPNKKLKSVINGVGPGNLNLAPVMERVDSMQSHTNASQTDKDEAVGPISPESLEPR